MGKICRQGRRCLVDPWDLRLSGHRPLEDLAVGDRQVPASSFAGWDRCLEVLEVRFHVGRQVHQVRQIVEDPFQDLLVPCLVLQVPFRVLQVQVVGRLVHREVLVP